MQSPDQRKIGAENRGKSAALTSRLIRLNLSPQKL
jgi:hypothetical protein